MANLYQKITTIILDFIQLFLASVAKLYWVNLRRENQNPNKVQFEVLIALLSSHVVIPGH